MDVQSWEGVMGVTAGRFKIEEAGIAVFAEAFPLEKIREILKATGREEKRKRQLPAVMMVYYVVALGLFVSVGCREVLRRLLRLLRRNMLCLADRNFTNYPLWKQACTTGAALVWRAKTGIILPKLRKLSDGSYLAKFYPSPTHRRHDREGILVRVIEYQI